MADAGGLRLGEQRNRPAGPARLAPEGLTYVASWVDEEFQRCFQVMAADDRRLMDEWIANWADLVDFEVVPVMTSKDAAERMAGGL